MIAGTKIPRIVELIRVSTKSQANDNTDQMQRRALDELRKRRPGHLVRRLEALGVSGSGGVADREDLQELADLAQAKGFDELRCYSLDRLTRSPDPRDRAAIIGMVSDAGATIVDCLGTVIDPAETEGGSELTYYMQTLFSARERKKILARTAAGRLRKAQDGLLVHGMPPYGRRFNHEREEWETVEAQVKVYKRIIAECLSGKSTREIAKGLNGDGVPCVKAAKNGHQPRWQHSSVKRLLKSASIVGEYKVIGHKTTIPAITTREEWDQVLAMLQRNRSSKSGPRAQLPALLRKKMRCAGCGRSTTVVSDGKGSTPRYVCARAHERDVPCPARRSIKVPDADVAVRAALLNLLVNSDDLLEAIKSQKKHQPKRSSSMLDLEEASKELARLDEREARALRLMNSELLTEVKGREELLAIKEARTSAEARKQRAALIPRAISANPSDKALKAAAREMGLALREASMERMVELLDIICPPEKPYGLSLSASGIEIVGRLPLGAGDLGHAAARCDLRLRPSRARL